MTTVRALTVAMAVALSAIACDTADPTLTTTSPTTATNPTVENFTGTVLVGQSDTHPFNVALSGGTLSVTLTTAGPPATVFMGLGVGSQSGGVCTILAGGSALVQAGTAPQLSGTVPAGAYCVQVFDQGNLTAPITYSVSVAHY